MSEHSSNEDEKALRDLVSNIIAIIKSNADALYNKIVDVPDIDDAVFEPIDMADSQTRPAAYRFVKDIVSLSSEASVKDLIEQFLSIEDSLIWGHAPGYDVKNVGQQFLDNYCHALLSGPDGPLKCNSPLGAFVLFGPDTLYKDHSHTPNEVYLAITGGGQWRVGDHDWRELHAGQVIYIPSESTHAIRTQTEPLLTFSFWLEPGDMNAISI